MSIEIIRIPQLGEGLQEALLVEYLTQPGDRVKRDQPLYVMETDKATTEVESPFDGQIVEWLVEPGQVLEIGTEIGRIQLGVASSTDAAVEGNGRESSQPTADLEPTDGEAAPLVAVAEDAVTADLEQPSTSDKVYRVDTSQSVRPADVAKQRHRLAGAVRVPPRTRRHLQQLGLMDRVEDIPTRGSKLMPEDVDRYVAEALEDGSLTESEVAGRNGGQARRATIPADSKSTTAFTERAIPRRQLTLNYRLQRGLHQVVPASAVIEVDWSGLSEAQSSTELTVVRPAS